MVSDATLFINDTVYVSTPFYRIFALDPGTGKTKWIYDSKAMTVSRMGRPAERMTGKTRGLAYWQASNPVAGQPCQKVLYLGTADGHLHAVDANTGHACRAFLGNHGVLNVNQWNTINPKFPYQLTTPPSVYQDTLVLGWGGVDWTPSRTRRPARYLAWTRAPVQLKWTFNTIPEDARNRIGTANCGRQCRWM